jgi:hypothetical protein
MEGFHCFNPAVSCMTRGLAAPVMEYGHEEGRCSIIGGYVYRGRAVPALQGAYVSGDFCSGEYLPSGNQTKAREGQHRRCCSRQGFGLSRLGKTKKAISMWRITEAACIGWSLVDGIL